MEQQSPTLPLVDGFKPISIYEKPEIFITQLLQDELSVRSAMALAFDSNRLTPEQRTSMEDYLLQGAPANGATRAAIGILTNPLTWVYFATGSAGANLASKGAGLFGRKVAAGIKHTAEKNPALLGALNLLTPSQMLHEHPHMLAALGQLARGIKGIEEEFLGTVYQGRTLGQIAEALHKKTGLRAIDPGQYPPGSAEHELAKKMTTAMHLRSSGAFTDWVEGQVSGKERYSIRRRGQDGEWGAWEDLTGGVDDASVEYQRYAVEVNKQARAAKEANEVEVREWIKGGRKGKRPSLEQPSIELRTDVDPQTTELLREAWVDREELLRVFEEVPELEDYYQAHQQAIRDRTVRLYGKEGLGVEDFVDPLTGQTHQRQRFELDREKSRRLYAGLSSDLFKDASLARGAPPSAGQLEGKALVTKLLGEDNLRFFREGINAGELTEEQFHDKLVSILEPQFQSEFFQPRNLKKGVELPGNSPTRDHIEQVESFGGYLDASDRFVIPRVEEDIVYDVADLDYIGAEFGGRHAPGFELQMDRAVRARDRAINRTGQPLFTQHIDGAKSWNKFMQDSGEAWATHIQDAPSDVRGAVRATTAVGGTINTNQARAVPTLTEDVSRVGDDIYSRPSPLSASPRGISLGELISDSYRMLPDENLKTMIKSTVLPAVTRRGIDNQHLISLGQFQAAKQFFNWITKTSPVKAMGETSWGRDLYQRMVMLGDPEFRGFGGAGMATGLSKLFYATHLGLNLGTMTMNMMQPFLLAGNALGFRNILPAYLDAAKEMVTYAKLRTSKYGNRLFLTPAEREGLIRESFEFGEEIGINGDVMEKLDGLMGRSPRTKSNLERWAIELPLKGFEKTEWFVRSVSAHAVKRQFESAWRNGPPIPGLPQSWRGSAMFRNTVERFNETVNFVPNELGTPMIFLPQGKDSFMGRVMSNPLSRQFLSFGLRSFTGAVHTMPRMGGGTRTLFGGLGPELSSYPAVLANDLLRGLGMSAIVYEAGKGLLGADLTRSLYGSSITDVAGLGRMAQQEDPGLPLPPAADIPLQFMQGFMKQDMDQLKQASLRVLPGGVGLGRILGAAPELPGNFLQRTYADYENVLPDGSVPVYDSRNGRLISYQKPGDLIVKALGVDLGRGKLGGELDGYLLAQRDEITKRRRVYIEMLLQNDMARAEAVRKKFERDYKVPLTVTKAQIEAIRRAKVTPRSERILTTMDKNVRPQLAAMASPTQRFNTPSELIGGGSRGQRDQAREGDSPVRQEDIERVLRYMRERDDRSSPAFQPFTGF